MLYFGLIDHGSERSITYKGEMTSGAVFEIIFNGTVSGTITLTNTKTRESFSIDISKVEAIVGGIQEDDIIRVNTNRGQKSVIHRRISIDTNVLNALAKRSDWMQLEPGKNTFSYTADEGVENLEFRVISNVVYEGI